MVFCILVFSLSNGRIDSFAFGKHIVKVIKAQEPSISNLPPPDYPLCL